MALQFIIHSSELEAQMQRQMRTLANARQASDEAHAR